MVAAKREYLVINSGILRDLDACREWLYKWEFKFGREDVDLDPATIAELIANDFPASWFLDAVWEKIPREVDSKASRRIALALLRDTLPLVVRWPAVVDCWTVATDFLSHVLDTPDRVEIGNLPNPLEMLIVQGDADEWLLYMPVHAAERCDELATVVEVVISTIDHCTDLVPSAMAETMEAMANYLSDNLDAIHEVLNDRHLEKHPEDDEEWDEVEEVDPDYYNEDVYDGEGDD